MHNSHTHQHLNAGNASALGWALGLTSLFLIAEIAGGFWSGSLALISDAAHTLTDVVALAIALGALYISRRPADGKKTFGYYRFEILTAAANAILLFMVALYILFEAYQRWRHPLPIQSTGMLAIAVLGIVVNALSMAVLYRRRDHHENNLNLKGAYLEVVSDLIGSGGVIAGALIIYFTGWLWIDSLIAVGIGVWVLPRAWRLLCESLNILLEGVPVGIGLIEVERAIQSIPGVASVHDLHIWSISSGKINLTIHIVCTAELVSIDTLLQSVCQQLAQRFKIYHTTIQIERVACEQAHDRHLYAPLTSHHSSKDNHAH